MCETCKTLRAKLRRIAEILEEPEKRVRSGRPPAPLTSWGILISAAATSKGRTLTEISTELGYGHDYVARVCRGNIKLVRRAAAQIGANLGIDLSDFVGRGGGPIFPPTVTYDPDARPAEMELPLGQREAS